MLSQTNLVTDVCVYGIGLLGLVCLLTAVVLTLKQPPSKRMLAALPRQINGALEAARKATSDCLAMRAAVEFTKNLRADRAAGRVSRYSLLRTGVSDNDLTTKSREKSLKALRNCRRLSAEAVAATTSARYYVLQGLFEAAEGACRECQPEKGQQVCPAAEFLEKISLT